MTPRETIEARCERMHGELDELNERIRLISVRRGYEDPEAVALRAARDRKADKLLILIGRRLQKVGRRLRRWRR